MSDMRNVALSDQPAVSAPRSDPGHQRNVDAVLAGSGEMGRRMRAFDWAATPLGPPGEWPQSLKTAARILLTSRFAMWMGWGPDLTFLYNDAYAEMTLGEKHPWALGRPVHEVWAEIWGDLESRIHTVLKTATATWDEGLLLVLERSGYPEETYHTFSYSPLTDDSGAVTGMLCVVVEETERVIGERRLATLRELAAALAAPSTEEEVLAAVGSALARNRRDLPFALMYLFDDSTDSSAGANRAVCCGINPDHAAAPPTIDLTRDDAPWPTAELRAAVTGGATARPVVDDLPRRFDAAELPTGDWAVPPRAAAIVPIARPGQARQAGFLIVGINPYRPFDAEYAGFVELIAGQIASSLTNARAYHQERQRADALAKLDRAKTTFFSNVSHELRTPLTLMLAPTEDLLAEAAGTVTAEQRELLGLLHRNEIRLLRLVNTLLDFSRIEAGRMQAMFRPTEIAGYTAELASNFRSATERAGLRLVVDVTPLPEDVAPVYIDQDMWEKVVLNLLSNALKHTFDGEIRVSLALSADRQHVELAVSDTGVGIADEHRAHLFERFHRVPNARSRSHEGTGIGLALVQELVRLHGGTIDVESQEGVGSTFTVRVPLGHAHLAAENTGGRLASAAAPLELRGYVEEVDRWLLNVDTGKAEPEQPEAAWENARLAPARVLIADDNADMREYVARLLRSRGWHVTAVGDGQQALDTIRAALPADDDDGASAPHAAAFDLVLSDVMMPGLDGFALLRELRADPRTRTVPVILLSARAGEEARVEGLDAGADDYLVKPFSARELIARVGAHVTLARAREQARVEVAAAGAHLSSVFAQAPVAIAVMRGPEHVFDLANDPYRRICGNRELLGHSIRAAFPDLAGQGIYEILDRVFETKTAFVGTELAVMMDRHGTGQIEETYFNFVYQPLLDPTGEAEGIAVVVVDVTDQVRSRQAAEAAQHSAEQANEAKSAFLTAMSHELRTPLNAIAGHAQLVELGVYGPVTDGQRDALGRIQRSEQHLLSLINDVLNFAKLEAGKVEYEIEDVALAAVVAEVFSMIEPQLRAKSLGSEVRVPTQLSVRADADKVRQILVNLLSNAIKFSGAGGRIVIDTAGRQDGSSESNESTAGVVFLRVTDTGCGIRRDKQEVIFDPFVQVHRKLTHPTEGTGLGLSISRDLARGMGGDLRVRSVEGEGSRFTLSLLAPTAPKG